MWGNTSMRLGKSSTMVRDFCGVFFNVVKSGRMECLQTLNCSCKPFQRPITALAAASGISGMTANSRMNRYALEIEKLNNARVQRTPYLILHALEGAAGDLVGF